MPTAQPQYVPRAGALDRTGANVDGLKLDGLPTGTALTASLAAKAAAADLTSHTGNTGNPHAVTKAQVGLGNADDTSDANKPVSAATQAALNAKAAKAGDDFTGPVTVRGRKVGRIVCAVEGDSLSAQGQGVSGRAVWTDYVQALSPHAGQAAFSNFAVGGKRASELADDYAAKGGSVDPATAGDEGTYYLFAGINDIADGTSAATVYGYLTANWALARADGYRVVAFTPTPHAGIAGDGRQDEYLALLALIRGDATKYDHLVDAAALLPDPNSATDFHDGIHTAPAGAQKIARAVAALDTYRPFDFTFGTAPAAARDFSTVTMVLNPQGGPVEFVDDVSVSGDAAITGTVTANGFLRTGGNADYSNVLIGGPTALYPGIFFAQAALAPTANAGNAALAQEAGGDVLLNNQYNAGFSLRIQGTTYARLLTTGFEFNPATAIPQSGNRVSFGVVDTGSGTRQLRVYYRDGSAATWTATVDLAAL